LRIEDIDQSRARSTWEDQIYDDLQWLDVQWDTPVLRQSDRMDAYEIALRQLWDRGFLYPCICTRGDIKTAIGAPQEGVPQHGPDGLIYPGTCRNNARPKEMPRDTTLRMDIAKAAAALGAITFTETGENPGLHTALATDVARTSGDYVIARKDMGTSYHLSVVIDDAAQGITDVVRGSDIQDATYLHVILQKLLGHPTPKYHHHKLIRDNHGKRLAKRDDARAIMTYRADGKSPQDIRAMVGLPPAA
jgi:glutamyl-Q tRNA(Asp) synthetase